MAADGSATVFCFAPRRVPVTERLKGPASSTAGAIPALAPGPCPVCPLLAEKVEASRQATSWRVMHRRAVAREDHLKQRVAELEAKRRWREQQLFGRKTETAAATVPPRSAPTSNPPGARPRGQQRGQPGHGRRDYSRLPVTVEHRERVGAACGCPRCHRPFAAVGGAADTTILESEVRAHRRLVRRRRYRPTGSAAGQQHGGTRATRTGRRTQELLRVRGGVGGPIGRPNVFAVADAELVGPQSTVVVDRVPGRMRHRRRQGSAGPRQLLAVEPV